MALPPGLTLYPEFISPEQEKTIITWLETQPWSDTLLRRIIQYGGVYNFSENVFVPGQPMTGPIQMVADLIEQQGWIPKIIHCLVNEYRRSRGLFDM